MSQRLSFQLELLRWMDPKYRTTILTETNISVQRAHQLSQLSEILVQENLGFVGVEKYIEIIGAPALVSELDIPAGEAFAGSMRYFFLLDFWPHLYWVVNHQVDGSLWGLEFINQTTWAERLEPALVRPGVWTQDLLVELADQWKLHDGWTDTVTLLLRFDDCWYEGTFTLGILQRWKRNGGASDEQATLHRPGFIDDSMT